MNEVEKKIRDKAQTRQARLGQKEKEELEMTAQKMTAEAKLAQAEVIKEGGVGRTKKSGGGRATTKQTTTPKSKTPATKKPTTPKDLTQPATPEKVKVPTPTTGVLTTKEVAAMVGTTPKALRRVLRAKWYNDGVMTHYTWTKNDPILKEILAHYSTTQTGTKDQ